VTREEFEAFLLRDARRHPSLYRGLLGVRPGTGVLKGIFDKDLRSFGVFGFTLPNAVYLRPELIRLPWLFRIVLRHELYHFRQHLGRAPPAPERPVRRLLRAVLSEAAAHLFEIFPRSSHLPQGYLLERVLRQAELSLRLQTPFNVLLVGSETATVLASDFEWLSAGKARVQTLRGSDAASAARRAQEHLQDPANRARYRAILLEGARSWVPEGQELRKLETAFRRMELLYLQRIASVRQAPVSWNSEKATPAGLWNEVKTPALQAVGLVRNVENLYNALQEKGVVLIPFEPGDPALGYLAKLLSHWQAADRGYFRTVRVDLAEGGHFLLAQKTEARVRVFLRPTNGATVAASVLAVYRDPVKRAAAEQVLRFLGLGEWIATFKELGVEVIHIFGRDVGETSVFVSLPRRSLPVIRSIVARGAIDIVHSDQSFRPLSVQWKRRLNTGNGLYRAVPRQKGPQAWKRGRTGRGMLIASGDTGAWTGHPDLEGAVEEEDFVDEGPEDWHGHGTQTMGDAKADGGWIQGMAPQARGFEGKVFTRGGGAADGDIKAFLARAMQKGADVIFLSLGSRGRADSELAQFVSGLATRQNAKGENPIFVISAGNSGSDDETVGQPGAGEEPITVGAATQADAQGRVRTALYTSAGWTYFSHGPGLDRPILKVEITGIGGNVNTPDEKGNYYKDGLVSPRSKDAEPLPSDTSDGLYTAAAGTSMSGPQVAGAAAEVKAEVMDAAKDDPEALQFAKQHMNFIAKMILMASAEDLRVPIQKQGAGLLNADAAVGLARRSFGRGAQTLGRSSEGFLGYDWIRRARRVFDLPRRVYEKAASAAAGAEKAGLEQGLDPIRVLAARERSWEDVFKTETERARPELLKALADEVWVVRFYAAFGLLALGDKGALSALAEAALHDADARVRQMALQAIAESASRRGQATGPSPGFSSEDLNHALRQAQQDVAPEVRVYASLALVRHGEKKAVQDLILLAGHAEQPVRFTALWALGKVGKAADAAVTETLSSVVSKTDEVDSNRHVAVSALGELTAQEEAFTPKVFKDLLEASGTHELVLTRSVHNSFFQKAVARPGLRRMMQSEPIRPILVEFVEKYRAAATQRGGLGDLVRLLARITGAELGSPMPVDPSGQGVPGVDENLGPVHMIVEIPEGRGVIPRTVTAYDAGLNSPAQAQAEERQNAQALEQALRNVQFPMDVLDTFRGRVRAVMREGFVSLQVPGYSAAAFTQQMAMRGFLVRRASPKFLFLRDTNPRSGIPRVHKDLGLTGVGVAVIGPDEGIDLSNEAFQDKVLGYGNTSGEGTVEDESVGHFTHAGNIAAGSPRSDGNPNYGRAPGAFLIPVKVLSEMGGSEATVMEGVSLGMQILDDANAKLAEYWKAKDGGRQAPLPDSAALRKAVSMGIRHFLADINLSLGGPGSKDSPLNVQLRRLHVDNRAMVSAAAGNEGPQEGTANRTSPANEWSIKTVGAVDKDGKPTFYSSRGTAEDPIIDLVHYGGDVVMSGSECPFLPGGIVSALAARVAQRMARCVVPHNGKPTDQAMSGTSMACPHCAGDDALVLEKVRQLFTVEEIAQTRGLYLWLDQIAYESASKIAGQPAHVVGAGLRDIVAELKVLDERLRDKEKVKAEAFELYKKAIATGRKRTFAGPLWRSRAPGAAWAPWSGRPCSGRSCG